MPRFLYVLYIPFALVAYVAAAHAQGAALSPPDADVVCAGAPGAWGARIMGVGHNVLQTAPIARYQDKRAR
jgi:hypothetical protein